MVIGPDVLDIAHDGPLVSFLANVGMSFLFFLAGLELDLDRVRGRPLRVASIGIPISLVLAAIVAGALSLARVVGPAGPVAIALMTTASSPASARSTASACTVVCRAGLLVGPGDPR